MKEKLLEISNLTYKYDSRSIKGIDNLSFDLYENDCLGLIGPSGSGKSTALKIIAGLMTPQSGEIKTKKDFLMSYVPQSTELPKETSVLQILMNEIPEIEDNEKRENQARSVLALLNITNEINSLPIEISGGQKQRVIIAKALVKNPTIILLDEPFGHLDEKLRFDLMTELFELFKKNQITTLWVTHETKEALAFSDKIMVLNHGKRQQISSPIELYERPINFFVANFLGRTNIVPLKAISHDSNMIKTKLFSRDIEISVSEDFILKDHKDLILLIKPEIISIAQQGRFKGKIQKQMYQGMNFLTQIKVANETELWLYTQEVFTIGQNISFNIDYSKVHALNEF